MAAVYVLVPIAAATVLVDAKDDRAASFYQQFGFLPVTIPRADLDASFNPEPTATAWSLGIVPSPLAPG